MTTKTDTPAVPAWALEAAQDIIRGWFNLEFPGVDADEKMAAIIVRHAAQDRMTLLDDAEARLGKLAAANAELLEALREALDHLDYCGWGDKWERECSEELRKRLPAVLAKHTPKEGESN